MKPVAYLNNPARLAVIPALLVLLLAGAAGFAKPATDKVAEGKRAFAMCATCHAVTADAPRKMGPNLFGVVGRKAGSMATPAPSPALKNSGIVWDAKTLDAFIASPRKTVPGTRMPYGGMSDAERRAAIVAYLETLK